MISRGGNGFGCRFAADRAGESPCTLRTAARLDIDGGVAPHVLVHFPVHIAADFARKHAVLRAVLARL